MTNQTNKSQPNKPQDVQPSAIIPSQQPEAFSIVSLRGRLLDDVRGHINTIWDDIGPEGQNSLLALENIFGSLFDMLEVTEKTLDDAAEVVEAQQVAVRLMQQQRDDALAELEGLVTAMEAVDVRNPKVRRVYEAIVAQVRRMKAVV